MNIRTLLTIMVILVVLLSLLSVYFIVSSLTWKHTVVVVERKNQRKLEEQIAKEKELIRKDLEEKYAADIVSYDAMAKRLEHEKQKAKELEEKLKNANLR